MSPLETCAGEYRCKCHPLTFIPGNALPTDVLRDGRVLFEAVYPLGSWHEIGTVHRLYRRQRSRVLSLRSRSRPSLRKTERNSGDIVFASANSLERFTSPLAQADPISAPKGQFAGDVVRYLQANGLLTWRKGPAEPYQLMQWTPGAPTLEPVAAQNGINLLQPILIASRAVPNRHPSGLHDWPNANLLCLNAYTSKYHFDPGSIATVKVYTAGPSGQPKLIGSSPVETDGSFFLHVPSDQPIKLELLDDNGKTLKKEAGWFWMRRGEQRICVGCHAGPGTRAR